MVRLLSCVVASLALCSCDGDSKSFRNFLTGAACTPNETYEPTDGSTGPDADKLWTSGCRGGDDRLYTWECGDRRDDRDEDDENGDGPVDLYTGGDRCKCDPPPGCDDQMCCEVDDEPSVPPTGGDTGTDPDGGK
jgi:hypothetical protein